MLDRTFIRDVLRAGAATGWPPAPLTASCLAAIVLGSGAYGATIGLWRSDLQGVYVAVKFPLLILMTTGGTGLMNWLLATLMGLQISFAASLRATLLSFALASLILGSLSPITFFLLLNAPPLGSDATREAYAWWMLAHVGIIAVAGIASTLRLHKLLAAHTVKPGLAGRILFTWLAANLFLGSQLSWNFRPFIGSPRLPVQFLRPNAFEGTFYEAVYRSARTITTPREGARHE